MRKSNNRKTGRLIGAALLLAAALTACGGGSGGGSGKTDTAKKPGSSIGGSGDSIGNIVSDTDTPGNTQGFGGTLGFRDVNYQVLNPNWTDTDHLALIDTEHLTGREVFVLDFGAGSNITKEARIQDVDQNNSYGVFGSVFQNTGDRFYLTSVTGNALELMIVKPDMWVTIRMEADDRLYYDEETSQVVLASNGHYDIVMPEDEYNLGQEYWALIYPTNHSWPLEVKIRGVGTLEKAEEYFAYIEEHTGFYHLTQSYDLSTVRDREGNAVDLSSYAFYTDLLSLDVAKRFGMNFKESNAIKVTSGRNLMIECSDKNWREVQFTTSFTPSENDGTVNFMGYQMYYASDKYLYLQYGEKQYIRIDIRHKIDDEKERKEWLEKEFFSSYVPNN